MVGLERPRSGTLGGGGQKAGFSVAASAWGFSSTVVLGEVDFLDGGSGALKVRVLVAKIDTSWPFLKDLIFEVTQCYLCQI